MAAFFDPFGRPAGILRIPTQLNWLETGSGIALRSIKVIKDAKAGAEVSMNFPEYGTAAGLDLSLGRSLQRQKLDAHFVGPLLFP